MPWFDSLKSRFRSKPTSSQKKHNAEQLRTQLDESRVLMDSLHKRMKKRCEQLQRLIRKRPMQRTEGRRTRRCSTSSTRRSNRISNLHGQLST